MRFEGSCEIFEFEGWFEEFEVWFNYRSIVFGLSVPFCLDTIDTPKNGTIKFKYLQYLNQKPKFKA
jgi:hypothetical protein